MSEGKGSLKYLAWGIILVLGYLLLTNWILTDKIYTTGFAPPDEMYLTFHQTIAPSECFKVEPLRINYNMEKKILWVQTYVHKFCEFSQAQIIVHARGVDFSRYESSVNLDKEDYQGGISLNYREGDMEEYGSYTLILYYTSNKSLFNLFRFYAWDPDIEHVSIEWINGIGSIERHKDILRWRLPFDIIPGYFCGENCFQIKEGNVDREEPIIMGKYKTYTFKDSDSVEILFAPKNSLMNLLQKFLDIVVLGLVVLMLDRFLSSDGTQFVRRRAWQFVIASLNRLLGFIRLLKTRLAQILHKKINWN